VSSLAALRGPSAIYREEQNFAWWLYALLALMLLLCGLALKLRGAAAAPPPPPAQGFRVEVPLPLLVGLVLLPVLVVGVLHMTTEVTPECCTVSFGWVPTYRRAIPLGEVRRVEVVRYRAIRDHGFWGLRTTRDGERVFTARGDRAVRLHLADGSRVLIGSQRPEELAAVLERERQSVA
jgi:hypothetical protein